MRPRKRATLHVRTWLSCVHTAMESKSLDQIEIKAIAIQTSDEKSLAQHHTLDCAVVHIVCLEEKRRLPYCLRVLYVKRMMG